MRLVFVFFIAAASAHAMQEIEKYRQFPVTTNLEIYENFHFRSPALFTINRLHDDLENGIPEAERFLDENTKTRGFPLYHFLQGKYLETKGEERAAIKQYNAAAREYPPAAMRLAQLYLKTDKELGKSFLIEAAQIKDILPDYRRLTNTVPRCFVYMPALKKLTELFRNNGEISNFIHCLELQAILEKKSAKREALLFEAAQINMRRGERSRALEFFKKGNSTANCAGAFYLQAEQVYDKQNLVPTIENLSSILELSKDECPDFYSKAETCLYSLGRYNLPACNKIIPHLLKNATPDNVQKAVTLSAQLLNHIEASDKRFYARKLVEFFESASFKSLKTLEYSEDESIRQSVLFHLGVVTYSVSLLPEENIRQQSINYFKQISEENSNAQLYLGLLHAQGTSHDELDKAANYFAAAVANKNTVIEQKKYAIEQLRALNLNGNCNAAAHLITIYLDECSTKFEDILQLLSGLPPESFPALTNTGAFEKLMQIECEAIEKTLYDYLRKVNELSLLDVDTIKQLIKRLELRTAENSKLFLFNLCMQHKQNFNQALWMLDEVCSKIQRYQTVSDEAEANDIIESLNQLKHNYQRSEVICLKLADFYKKGVDGLVEKDEKEAIKYLMQASQLGNPNASYDCAVYARNKEHFTYLKYVEKAFTQGLAKQNENFRDIILPDIITFAQTDNYTQAPFLVALLAKSENTIHAALDLTRRTIEASGVSDQVSNKVRLTLQSLMQKNPEAAYLLGYQDYCAARKNTNYKQKIEYLLQAITYMEQSELRGYTKKDIEKNHFIDACYQMGCHYLLIKDSQQAFYMFQKCSNSDDLRAKYYLARGFFQEGERLKNDKCVVDGLELMGELANKTHAPAILLLAGTLSFDDEMQRWHQITKEQMLDWLNNVYSNPDKKWHQRLSAFELMQRHGKTDMDTSILDSMVTPNPEEMDYFKGRLCLVRGDYQTAIEFFKKAGESDIRALAYLAIAQTKNKTDDQIVLNSLYEFFNRFPADGITEDESDEIMQVVSREVFCGAHNSIQRHILLAFFDLRKYEFYASDFIAESITSHMYNAVNEFWELTEQGAINEVRSFVSNKDLWPRVLKLAENNPDFAHLVAVVYARMAVNGPWLFENKSKVENFELAIRYNQIAVNLFKDKDCVRVAKNSLAHAYWKFAEYCKNQTDPELKKKFVPYLQKSFQYNPEHQEVLKLLGECYLRGQTELADNKAIRKGIELLTAKFTRDDFEFVKKTFMLLDKEANLADKETKELCGVVKPQTAINYVIGVAEKSDDRVLKEKCTRLLFSGDESEIGIARVEGALKIYEQMFAKAQKPADLAQCGIYHYILKDYKKAFKCLNDPIILNNCNHSLPFVYLSFLYKDGLGTDSNLKESFNYLERAVNILLVKLDRTALEFISSFKLLEFMDKMQKAPLKDISERAQLMMAKYRVAEVNKMCKEICVNLNELERLKKQAESILVQHATNSNIVFSVHANVMLADITLCWINRNDLTVTLEDRYEALQHIISYLKQCSTNNLNYDQHILDYISSVSIKFIELFHREKDLKKEFSPDQLKNLDQQFEELQETWKNSGLRDRLASQKRVLIFYPSTENNNETVPQ